MSEKSLFWCTQWAYVLTGENPQSARQREGYNQSDGVHRELKSEGRQRQISSLTNRNLIRLYARVRLPNKSKSNSCTELYAVYEADVWRERTCEYLVRSRQREETWYKPRSNNEW